MFYIASLHVQGSKYMGEHELSFQTGRISCAVEAESPSEAEAKILALLKANTEMGMVEVAYLERLFQVSKLPQAGVILEIKYYADPTAFSMGRNLPDCAGGCEEVIHELAQDAETKDRPFFVNEDWSGEECPCGCSSESPFDPSNN